MFKAALVVSILVLSTPAQAMPWRECLARLAPGLDPTTGPVLGMVDLAEDISRDKDAEEVGEALAKFRAAYGQLVKEITNYCISKYPSG